MNYSLEVENVSKTYSNFKLDNISFAVPKGSIMGFVGENGAGKTTAISCILNTIKKDNGTIKIFGKEMSDNSTDIREDIGVVFDAINFSQYLTAKKLQKVFSGIYKDWDNTFFKNIINKLDIPLNKNIKELSRGMSMKLAIAVALSHHPKLLILDEATSGLDPIIREEILDVFLEFVTDEEHSILMSSHITSDLEKIADYITFIYRGKIILTEKKDALMYEYGIARCKEEQLNQLDKEDLIAYRYRGLQVDVLVSNKKAFEQKYKGVVVDNATIDEITLLLVKGGK
ncbi:ABC-2 type transport system ATP-binding protein [Natranaerovirga hydrolytica]|uniref:ABC-2 type transport system ATP-binding protein n=1 Tax=Natranaerovirga hydrolytica TaxID=680378 RepID=A0A4R1MHC0_9FIRM|nr:ABC transporter ATP-binding protein [Natranaerovirga hydrolytica]TCK90524.1 ABC-2 type transport system ATP-binding protein [Natranaerovirga hydrolytica]